MTDYSIEVDHMRHLVKVDNGWCIKPEGSNKCDAIFTDKLRALVYSKKFGKCTVLHDKKGKFEAVDCNTEVFFDSDTHHVKFKQGQWLVEEGGEILNKFNSKDKAITYANEMAKFSKVCMVVHSDDGSLESMNCPPRNIDLHSIFGGAK